MIIVLRPDCTPTDITTIENRVREFGYEPRTIHGVERVVIAAIGDEREHRTLTSLISSAQVEAVIPVQKRFKLASREVQPHDSVIQVGSETIGNGHFMTIAGPCSVESRDQLFQVARDVKQAGLSVLRGGAYKPRTSPYDFQGLGQQALELLAEAKQEFGLAIVTEIISTEHLAEVAKVADVLQVGARNCQNYHLLASIADAGRVVLLKRGMATKLEEWLSAAEYLLVHGCSDVILCERGIRTFETSTRNTLDLNSVIVAKQETHLPVIIDPSHAAGDSRYVLALARAGIAAGADGLILETHPNPDEAWSDAAQQLPSATFADCMTHLRPYVELARQLHD